jgi:DNA-binding MarR family transcriptional regulator
LAAEVWRHLFDFIIKTSKHRTRVLSRYALTPNDSRALFSLSDREGRPLRALAEEWQCDPPNATWAVDRLERAGLAERRPFPGDRRVKLVVLTPKGLKTRQAIAEALYAPPEELLALETAQLESLADATRSLIVRKPL